MKNLSSVNYAPGEVPINAAEYPRFLREEFARIAATFALLAAGHLDKQHAAPGKPRDGDIRYAAGAPAWDPGSGKGLYLFNGTVWTLIKAIP